MNTNENQNRTRSRNSLARQGQQNVESRSDGRVNLSEKIANVTQGTIELVASDYELRIASVLVEELVNEIDRKKTPILKAAPIMMRCADQLSKIRLSHAERLYGRKTSLPLAVVDLIFKKFEFLVKNICENDIEKIEKFADGLRKLGQEIVEAQQNQRC